MMPITAWKLYDNETRTWQHNHIESGHVPATQETPTVKVKCRAQEIGWQKKPKGSWLKRRCYLNAQGQMTNSRDGGEG